MRWNKGVRRMLACLLAVGIVAGSPMCPVPLQVCAAQEEELSQMLLKLDAYQETERYSAYLERVDTGKRPNARIELEASDYIRAEGMEVSCHRDFEGMEGVSVLTGEEGLIEYAFTVEEEGLYEIGLQYYPVEGKSAGIQRGIFLDGELPYRELSVLEFSRVWKNAVEQWEVDNQGNDIKPMQTESPRWMLEWCQDSQGYIPDRLAVYLTRGEHTLTLVSQREPMMLRRLILTNHASPGSYGEVMEQNQRMGRADATGFLQVIEAEEADRKSSQMLYPVQDQSSPSVSPYSASALKNNAIGGNGWRLSGQWLEWDFEVPADAIIRSGSM